MHRVGLLLGLILVTGCMTPRAAGPLWDQPNGQVFEGVLECHELPNRLPIPLKLRAHRRVLHSPTAGVQRRQVLGTKPVDDNTPVRHGVLGICDPRLPNHLPDRKYERALRGDTTHRVLGLLRATLGRDRDNGSNILNRTPTRRPDVLPIIRPLVLRRTSQTPSRREQRNRPRAYSSVRSPNFSMR